MYNAAVAHALIAAPCGSLFDTTHIFGVVVFSRGEFFGFLHNRPEQKQARTGGNSGDTAAAAVRNLELEAVRRSLAISEVGNAGSATARRNN